MVRDSASSSETAGTRLRTAVAGADRLRRARERQRRAWRSAPYVAAASLCAGLLGAVRGWPAVLPPELLVAGLGVLIAYAYLTRRSRTISDRAAAAIDADAGLNGELRSAHWFAARDTHDPWADFHVERAADRLAAFDWPRVYAPFANARAKFTTGGLAAATLLLPLAVPALSGVLPRHRDARGAAPLVAKPVPVSAVPIGLTTDLEALLSAVENGTLRVESPAEAAALRSLLGKLSQLDGAESLKQLARAMASQTDPAHRQSDEAVMKALAERVERAAENATAPPPVRDALENLSDDLSDAAQAERAAIRDPREGLPAGSSPDAAAVQMNAAAKSDERSIQMVREADAGGGAAMLMVANPNAGGGDPGSGLGGGSGVDAQQGRMADIGRALRRETIEAHENGEGTDPLTDLRRKSERGQASVNFTHSAARPFDAGHVSGPPPVPEARRAAIQSYFVRKP